MVILVKGCPISSERIAIKVIIAIKAIQIISGTHHHHQYQDGVQDHLFYLMKRKETFVTDFLPQTERVQAIENFLPTIKKLKAVVEIRNEIQPEIQARIEEKQI